MDDKSIQILLSNVASNGNINTLIQYGLSYKQIAELTDFAISNGYVDITATSTILSESGNAKLIELRSDMKNVPKEEWITSEEKSKIKKITKDFIYLPNLDELP